VDHAARSWLLQMADAWLHLASEPNGEGGASRLMSSGVFSRGNEHNQRERYRLAVQRAQARRWPRVFLVLVDAELEVFAAPCEA
jgi:hypothetical protein